MATTTQEPSNTRQSTHQPAETRAPSLPGGPLLSPLSGLSREHGFEPLRIEGTMPAELSGTYYRNAPSRFDVGPSPHWFDGQGAIAAVRFAGGRVQGAVKLVHTPSGDHDLGRAANRYGAFGQRMSWGQRLRAFAGGQGVRNAANVNVMPWQGKLYALYETVLPVAVDPDTLACLGETNLGGAIKGAWNAHPHRVPARRTTYQFGTRVGRKCMLDVYALPDEGNARLMTSIPLPGVTEVHDVFASENYLVFGIAPYWSTPLKMLANGSFAEALVKREGEPSRFIVVPIDDPSRTIEIETEPFFFWHALNAYDDAGRIVLDFIRYDDYHRQARWVEETSAGRDGGHQGSTVVRTILDPTGRTARSEVLHDRPGEFPIVHPTRAGSAHRFGWMAAWDATTDGHGWFDRIARIDVGSGARIDYDPGPRCAVGEPAVVARSEREDDVWVLSLVRDLTRNASCLAVWDGLRAGEPVARAWFSEQLPVGLHGTWLPSLT